MNTSKFSALVVLGALLLLHFVTLLKVRHALPVQFSVLVNLTMGYLRIT